MKKVLSIIAGVIMCLFLAACSIADGGSMFFESDTKTANNYIEKVLNTIESKNYEQLESLFANNCLSEIESFDLSAEELFDYFDAEVISYDDWGGGEVDTIKEDDSIVKTFWSTLDVKTNKETYRIMMKYITQDTNDTDNIGLHSLYIIRAKDDFDISFAYWGDGNDTLGINIGIKNTAKFDDITE